MSVLYVMNIYRLIFGSFLDDGYGAPSCTSLFWLKPWHKGCYWVVMTVDNNKTSLTKVSAWFIIVEVVVCRKYPLKLVNLY